MSKVSIPVLAPKERIIAAMREGDRLDAVLALMQVGPDERQDPKYQALYEALGEVYGNPDLIDIMNVVGKMVP